MKREFTEREVAKFIDALISGQVALHYFQELKHTRFYKFETKQKLNKVLESLMKNEVVFEKIQEEAENATDDVHDAFFNLIKVVTQITIADSQNAAYVLQAYNKDPKRLEGLVKKILNDKNPSYGKNKDR